MVQRDSELLGACGVGARTRELADRLGMSVHTVRRKMRGEQPLKMEEYGSMLVVLGAGALPDITAEVLPPAWRLNNWDGRPLGILRATVPSVLATSARSELAALSKEQLTIGDVIEEVNEESASVGVEVLEAPGCAGKADLDRVLASIRSRMDSQFRRSGARSSVVSWAASV